MKKALISCLLIVGIGFNLASCTPAIRRRVFEALQQLPWPRKGEPSFDVSPNPSIRPHDFPPIDSGQLRTMPFTENELYLIYSGQITALPPEKQIVYNEALVATLNRIEAIGISVSVEQAKMIAQEELNSYAQENNISLEVTTITALSTSIGVTAYNVYSNNRG